MRQARPKWTGLFARGAASVGAVGVVTFVYLNLIPANSTTAALTFMLWVLVVSAIWSRWEALVAALAAGLSLDYFFFPPKGFRISDPNDIVALISFIVCALIASQLALNARRRAAEANHRQDEVERLYAISRAFMLIPEDVNVPSFVTLQLVQIFGFQGVALYQRDEDRVYRSGAKDVPLTDAQLSSAPQLRGEPKDVLAPDGAILSLAHDGVPVGTLAVLFSGVTATTLHAIANLAAVTLSRSRQHDTVKG
jgi:two-component system, OmpR family, sensor histidine kinase KdpD